MAESTAWRGWGLVLCIAFGANFLFGFGAYRPSAAILRIPPLSAAVAFLLIVEIDSPRRRLVRVQPQKSE